MVNDRFRLKTDATCYRRLSSFADRNISQEVTLSGDIRFLCSLSTIRQMFLAFSFLTSSEYTASGAPKHLYRRVNEKA